MFCPNCGAEVEEGAKFCNHCGTDMSAAGSAATNESTYTEENVQQAETYTDNSYDNSRVVNEPVNGIGTNRNIALCIVLSFITCGIYSLYWMYVLNEEINSLSGHENDTNGGLVLLFTIISCGIYGIYWSYKMGEKTDEIKNRLFSGSANNSSILFLILALFGLSIVNFAIMQDTINKAVA